MSAVAPHPAGCPHTRPRPGRVQVLQQKRERAAERGGTGWEGCLQKRQTQMGRECKERAAIRGGAVPWGQVQVLGPRAPTVTAPEGARLDSSPAGDGNRGCHLPVYGLMPRPLHQRWAEVDCGGRLSPEAVSAGQASGGKRAQGWAHHSLHPEEAAALQRGCHGLGWDRGFPSRGPRVHEEGLPCGA